MSAKLYRYNFSHLVYSILVIAFCQSGCSKPIAADEPFHLFLRWRDSCARTPFLFLTGSRKADTLNVGHVKDKIFIGSFAEGWDKSDILRYKTPHYRLLDIDTVFRLNSLDGVESGEDWDVDDYSLFDISARFGNNDNYSSVAQRANKIDIYDVDLGALVVTTPDSLDIEYSNSNIKNVRIINSCYEKNKPLPRLNFNETYAQQDGKNKTELFYFKGFELGSLELRDKRRTLKIEDCRIDSPFFAQDVIIDTLMLSGVHFNKINTEINVGNKKQIVLYLSNVNLENCLFYYQGFKYDPPVKDSRHLEVVNNFKRIINMQRKLGNEEGTLMAAVDSCIYEDRQKALTAMFIPVKIWWNNYGYDKVKVVISSIELFLFVSLINLLLFKKIRSVYELEGIQARVNNLGKSGFYSMSRYVLLCFIYTGFVFFGLRFDLEKLKLSSLPLAIWIILQYVLGIVCLGYIANLVISS